MGFLLKLLAVWGMADSLWMALDPAGWSRFWRQFVGRVGEGGPLARGMAAAQFVVSLYVFWRSGKS